jgi:transposase-like protein
MNRFIPFLIIVIFFVSCGSSLEEENSEMRANVIAVHDEVMPMMGKLKSLEKRAISEASELEAESSSDSLKIQELKALAYDLEQAYEAMFVWMRQYDNENGERSPEEVKAYLEEQMEKVKVVNEKITTALNKAEKTLKD